MTSDKPCLEIELLDGRLLYVYADDEQDALRTVGNYGVSRFTVIAVRPAPELQTKLWADNPPKSRAGF